MLDGSDAIYLVYGAAALAAIMVAEAVYLLYASSSDRRMAVNRRMKLQENKLTQEQVLIQLRKERGLEGGGRLLSIEGLRKLRMQSGMVMPVPRFLMTTSGIALGLMFGFVWTGLPPFYALLGFPLLCLVLPVLVLKVLRGRRHKMFGRQLPEALELITRSLKAGHPVPVAISMVAREMADPIGTEFGVVADEVTYGSDLVSALNSMFERVGHEDLPLFVTAVSIQHATGGNLREILDGLSNVIRERGKLRRKIRSISTEGRMSAYILTAVPVLLGLAMNILMPDMYASVADKPMTWYMLAGTLLWLLLGIASMFKMSNFKF
jgi:tight adherence protein B